MPTPPPTTSSLLRGVAEQADAAGRRILNLDHAAVVPKGNVAFLRDPIAPPPSEPAPGRRGAHNRACNEPTNTP